MIRGDVFELISYENSTAMPIREQYSTARAPCRNNFICHYKNRKAKRERPDCLAAEYKECLVADVRIDEMVICQ